MVKECSIEGVVIEDPSGMRYKIRFDMFPDSLYKTNHASKAARINEHTTIKPIVITPIEVLNSSGNLPNPDTPIVNSVMLAETKLST